MQARQERTFYNYQLLRKYRFSKVVNYSYMFLGLLAAGAACWADGILGIAYSFLAWSTLIWIHYVISRSLFVIDRYTYRKRWGFQWKPPWIGFLPLEQQFIGFRYWSKILLSTLLIGIVIIGALSPWLPLGFTLQFLFWHLWIIGPRLFTTIAAMSVSEDKLIKLETNLFLIYKA
ncbi:hypothetical protein MH117_25750 [Paenibacillus sp. ACRRX]|uniref:hypothetical protein n=1 Tax=Paenibacillus sp. ACRRX TaxID=2918206 RepID=UPI001EF409AA|nr:hypothetical protein [Paenibacillus sp. ACRRX]MCG7410804.1 hypothetical protein [Paenibacillus sp. ACRRX]